MTEQKALLIVTEFEKSKDTVEERQAWQRLIDTGAVWKLPTKYQVVAVRAISLGQVHKRTDS